jgi:vancomycin permeability regulator SanA
MDITPSSSSASPRQDGKRGQTSRRRKAWRLLAGSLLVILLGSGLIYADVRCQGNPIYTDPHASPIRPVAIVFGAGYGKSGPSPMLYDRVAAAAELYKAGKVRKLLLTGDNSKVWYNEPETMRQTALRLGVPDQDIVLDYAGFRTYDSLYRARDIFGVRQAILVTQSYHLPRALFIARTLGMDVVGEAADRQNYGLQLGYGFREVLASENAWIEAWLLHPHPRFLGRKEPIRYGTNPH